MRLRVLAGLTRRAEALNHQDAKTPRKKNAVRVLALHFSFWNLAGFGGSTLLQNVCGAIWLRNALRCNAFESGFPSTQFIRFGAVGKYRDERVTPVCDASAPLLRVLATRYFSRSFVPRKKIVMIRALSAATPDEITLLLKATRA